MGAPVQQALTRRRALPEQFCLQQSALILRSCSQLVRPFRASSSSPQVVRRHQLQPASPRPALVQTASLQSASIGSDQAATFTVTTPLYYVNAGRNRAAGAT